MNPNPNSYVLIPNPKVPLPVLRDTYAVREEATVRVPAPKAALRVHPEGGDMLGGPWVGVLQQQSCPHQMLRESQVRGGVLRRGGSCLSENICRIPPFPIDPYHTLLPCCCPSAQ